MRPRSMWFVAPALLCALMTPVVAQDRDSAAVQALDPVTLARLTERPRAVADPAFQQAVLASGARYARVRAAALAADPERRPDPNLCTVSVACVGDPRLDDFPAHGGVVHPLLFTARTGATLSGHVWAARSGPARRPLVVIVNGSLIDIEQGHWPVAQVLAQQGYVVLTFDAQGEGMSDATGAGRDALDSVSAGLPGLPDNGRPFFDGAVDALDFALSTPAQPFRPRVSRATGTSHADKQDRRVREGRDAAFNPLWSLVDRRRVGLAGYSYGAVAASWVAQADPRVSAVVAWDSLCTPADPSRDEVTGLFLSNPTQLLPGVQLPLAAQIPRTCFGAPPGPAPRLRTPALGISADIVLPGLLPSTDPWSKAASSRDHSQSGVDSGQLVLQGGTHADFVFQGSAAPLPARERGLDLVAWYSTAWFDKYLKGDPTADRRLLTRRWHADPRTQAIDPVGDGNLHSQLYASRLAITTADGRRWTCEDLRRGCPGMSSRDGFGSYSYLSVATGHPAAQVTTSS